MSIAIVTVSGDAHSAFVKRKLEEKCIPCDLVETDLVSNDVDYALSLPGKPIGAECLFNGIDLKSVSLTWWRRLSYSQKSSPGLLDPSAIEFINSGSANVIRGMFLYSYNGRFVDHPIMISRAENKINQIMIASRVGLNVPPTIISSSYSEVKRFFEKYDLKKVVAKPLGTSQNRLIRVDFHNVDDLYDEELKCFPTIVQAYVEGVEHYRVMVFGEKIICMSLVSLETDWRFSLPESGNIIPISKDLTDKIKRLMSELGISMGIIDFKVDPRGNPFFFEVNPQGQFLFSDFMTGTSTGDIFVDYLVNIYKSGPDNQLPFMK